MSEAEDLRTFAEVAIAVAGFSGVVLVLGRRSTGMWAAPWERLRFRLLLLNAGTVVLFSFVPLLLHSASLPEPLVWRISNAALGAFGIGITIYISVLQYRFVRGGAPRGLWVYPVLVTGGVVFLLQLAHSLGAFPGLGGFLHSLSLFFLLSMSFLNFGLLLLSTQSQE